MAERKQYRTYLEKVVDSQNQSDNIGIYNEYKITYIHPRSQEVHTISANKHIKSIYESIADRYKNFKVSIRKVEYNV